jgi:hypothetical protein
MAGPRPKGHPENIEGSGFNYHDKVVVTSDNEEVTGYIEAVHKDGKRLDVRIDHPGHSSHGRVVTFDPADVEEHPDADNRRGVKVSAAKD